MPQRDGRGRHDVAGMMLGRGGARGGGKGRREAARARRSQRGRG